MRFLNMSQLYSELRPKDTHFFWKNAQYIDNFNKFWLLSQNVTAQTLFLIFVRSQR